MMKKGLSLVWSVLVVVLAAQPMTLAAEDALLIWSHWGKEPVKINFMNAVAAEFEKQHGIPVEIVWKDKNDLMERLPLAMSKGKPDISYIDSGFSHKRIVLALEDLSSLTFDATLAPGWSLGSVGDRSNNYLPIEGISNAIFYNKDLFAQANITLPEDRAMTGEEFLEIVRQLRENGITPVAEGTADRGFKIGIPLINAIFRFAGPEKTIQLVNREINFSDPDIVKALEFWKQVVDAGAYNSDQAMKLTMNEGIFAMTDGEAAMNFCGTWIYSKFGATERDNGQVGVLDWFTVDGGNGNDFYELAYVAGFGVNTNSPRVEEARQFIQFLMTPQAATLWLEHVQAPYPVMSKEIPEDSLYGTLLQLREGKQPVNQLFSYPYFGTKAATNMWDSASKSLIKGNYPVEQFVKDMNSRMR